MITAILSVIIELPLKGDFEQTGTFLVASKLTFKLNCFPYNLHCKR